MHLPSHESLVSPSFLWSTYAFSTRWNAIEYSSLLKEVPISPSCTHKHYTIAFCSCRMQLHQQLKVCLFRFLQTSSSSRVRRWPWQRPNSTLGTPTRRTVSTSTCASTATCRAVTVARWGKFSTTSAKRATGPETYLNGEFSETSAN
jgi:hypothetical protein